jgi:mono/diheme cytochrome c family protein
MLHRTLYIALIIIALVPALAAAGANNAADVAQVTWAEHVAPILFDNCAGCHRPGQTAPMSLLSYEEARPWAKSIRKATYERAMPPWFANPEHGDFVEDSRLDEDQIGLISAWVEAGAPAGDLSAAPTPPVFTDEWRSGTPDVVLTMDPFEVTDEMEDHYQWVKVSNPLDEDRWIKTIEVRPTFMDGAHHNLTYIAPAGTTLESIQGAGRTDMDFVAGWAPGVVPMTYKEGYGKLLPAKSSIFFQMHYHKTPGPGTGGIDETSVGLHFYEGEVENQVATMWIVDPMLNIPPGESNYQSVSVFEVPHEAEIFNFTPHMHLRGKAMRFTATYPDGREEILLDVPDYDFNWQLTYTPSEPLVVPAGTRIDLAAMFDNSADNPANPDPAATVTFGEKTTDEMMIGFLDYTFVEQDKQADMPTYSVPEHMQEQWEKMQQFRAEQKRKAAEGGE